MGQNPDLPIMLVDDEQSWLDSLAFSLEYELGIDNVVQCCDSRECLSTLEHLEVSLVVLDINMPHMRGDELLKQILERDPGLPVIMLSGMNDLEVAVECVKSGAYDYFSKTGDIEHLLIAIRNLLSLCSLRRERDNLKQQLLEESADEPSAFAGIVTRDAHMKGIFSYLDAVHGSREPILINGESGTGKELIAEAIHHLGGAQRPFIKMNVAGLDDTVFSDTLFGHVRGAFTGAERERSGMIAQAGDGVLFLDEIGDLSSASQVKLLRLLQDGSYYPVGSDSPEHCRAHVVVATNHDLLALVGEGRFRNDLYYRLNTHQVNLPPLRKRRDDLPLLVEHFLREAAQRAGLRVLSCSAAALQLLEGAAFPGNVRELRSLILDAALSAGSERLTRSDFQSRLTGCVAEAQTAAGGTQAGTIIFPDPLPSMAEASEQLFHEALRRAGGKQAKAARLLGVTPQAISKRLKAMKEENQD